MAGISRTFILNGEGPAQMLYAFLKQNREACAAAGRPLSVRVSEHRAKRSDEQNALMWVWLGQIAEQAAINGQRFSADAWNRFFKEELLPEETSAGLCKWMPTPKGRELMLSTSDLNVSEMSEYMERLSAYAASELGVELT